MPREEVIEGGCFQTRNLSIPVWHGGGAKETGQAWAARQHQINMFLIVDICTVIHIIRITMPDKPLETNQQVLEKLAALGQQIRAHRKALKVSAVAAAESAGISRVTFHRIERGTPSVTMGAYLSAMTTLGMALSVASSPVSQANNEDQSGEVWQTWQGWIPARIKLDNYPQLKQLAWQVQGSNELKPAEALSIYERNWRHVDVSAMEPQERNLVDALRQAFEDVQRDI